MKELKLIEDSPFILNKDKKGKILGGVWQCTNYEVLQNCLAFHKCGQYTEFPGSGYCNNKTWYGDSINIPLYPVNPSVCSTKQ